MSLLNGVELATTKAMTPCLDPVRKLRQLDCVTTNTTDDAPPELAHDQSSTTGLSRSSAPSTPSLSRREYCTSESGSPTKVQSPLRHSVSYSERPELPFPFPCQHTATTDPTKSPIEPVNRMVLTGDKRNRPAQPSWLITASSPSHVMSQANATKSRASGQMPPTEPPYGPKTPNSTPTSASRFSFLSTAFKGLTSSPSTPRPVDDDDDLINLNIDQTLHSMTSPTDRSTFSPAAFKNLQLVATGLLHKFQDAYTERTMEIRQLRAEQFAQAEEQSEAETKMQHLRMQLEGMAQKAAEQEQMMHALMDEIAYQKRLPLEQSNFMSGGASISEDLGAEEDQRRSRRKSGGTSRSDTSYDTDEEGTEHASVFSTRSRSPTLATVMSDLGTIEALNPTPQGTAASAKPDALSALARTCRTPQTQMTAFQKLFKGLSVDNSETTVPQSCQNCQGQDVSVAWDTVSLLKDENKGLKLRVGDLEGALEGALDVVNGVGL